MRLPDFRDESWEVVAITSLAQTNVLAPIPSQEFPLKSAICWVQVQCIGCPESWHLAGWASALLVVNGERSLVRRFRLSLKSASLIVLPKTSVRYFLQLSFPRWLPKARVVIKEFTGDDNRLEEMVELLGQQLNLD